jgi:hypothetical protein
MDDETVEELSEKAERIIEEGERLSPAGRTRRGSLRPRSRPPLSSFFALFIVSRKYPTDTKRNRY